MKYFFTLIKQGLSLEINRLKNIRHLISTKCSEVKVLRTAQTK